MSQPNNTQQVQNLQENNKEKLYPIPQSLSTDIQSEDISINDNTPRKK